MKKIISATTLILLLGISATICMAENSSVEKGRQLFNDPTLAGSTNDRTCNTCHHNGDGLQHSGNQSKLKRIINKCITGPLHGEKLKKGSMEMTSLVLYIKSLGE